MDQPWSPPLRVVEVGNGCRIELDGLASGQGRTLQEAGDALIERLLGLARAYRGCGATVPRDLGPVDLRTFEFVYELAALAAAGDDIRARVFSAGAAGPA
jgi:hypothetical protein